MAEDLVASELTVGGRTRTFTVRPPQDRDAPLVMALHGNLSGADERLLSGGVGQLMDRWLGFGAHADEWGIAVAYPDGWHRCWADGRGVTPADEADIDDIAFLRAMIDWCADRFGTRSDQTVVAGISNGAFMSHRVALELSDRVPVFAAVAGALPVALSDIQPTHAVSAMLINGTADPIQPIEGGYSRHRGRNGELRGRTLGLTESAERWRTIDGCHGEGATATTALSSRHTVDGGVGGSRVTAWTVFGGGHAWPNAAMSGQWPDSPCSATTPEFDAAVEIFRFAQPLLVSAHARKL
ncbi:alpha/beta hydrolase family esterase [Nocardia sp. CA-107356]|uniref:alpha/beta hydrolase family esterase n=1 Tax=Nocardia sp. CA-107356 TaxID=3239972 RepID=UPI003D8FB0ED